MRLIILIFSILLTSLPASCEVNNTNTLPPFKTSGKISTTVQKYTGFTLFTRIIAESILNKYISNKTQAEHANVDLKTYSGIDLIKRKLKSANFDGENLLLQNIPIETLEIALKDPISIKKIKKPNGRVKYDIEYPINGIAQAAINLNKTNEVINNLPKWKDRFNQINLPLPPFGSIKVKITDFNISVDDYGKANIECGLTSLDDPTSSPLKIRFTGDIKIDEKKVFIKNINSEIEDVFKEKSDLSNSFNKVLEDLINPIFDFSKYEKKGIKINTSELLFKDQKINLMLDFILSSKETK